MRNLEKSRVITDIANRESLSLEVAQLDMNDDTYVKDATSKIVAKKGRIDVLVNNGRIDVLVNNAGYDLFSPIEDVTLNQAKEQFETNFFGVVRLA